MGRRGGMQDTSENDAKDGAARQEKEDKRVGL